MRFRSTILTVALLLGACATPELCPKPVDVEIYDIRVVESPMPYFGPRSTVMSAERRAELETALWDEMLAPKPESRAPDHLVRAGQAWIDDTARCYKCAAFRSNAALTGRCALKVKPGLYSSHDTMPGDGCRSDYSPVWPDSEGDALTSRQTQLRKEL